MKNIEIELSKLPPNVGHDTLGLILIDHDNSICFISYYVIIVNYHYKINIVIMHKIFINIDIFGGCATSGMAFKENGRVGDSPIIGSGLYVDNDVIVFISIIHSIILFDE